MNVIKPFVISLLFILLFLRYLYPVSSGRDTDIFWHLKTGEIICHEHHLPSSDPFTFTPQDPTRERIILKSYWLADLILYGVYKAWGFAGLAVLRSALLCLTVFFVYRSLLKRGFFVSVILSLILGFAIMPMSAIRPNLFSFFFAAAMILLMEKYREEQGARYQVGLVIVMLLWANMHGGYIVGAGILMLYMLGVGIAALPPLRNEKSAKVFLPLSVTAGAAIGATLINPLGGSLFFDIGDRYMDPANKLLVSRIETEMGLFRSVAQYPNEMVLLSLIVVGVILVYTALNLTRRRAGPAETLTVLALLILSLISVRVLPIFMVVGLIVSGGKGHYHMFSGKTSNCVRGVAAILLVAILGFLTYKELPKASPGDLVETDSVYLRMGDFLDRNRINGNMLNQELMGNFIIYRLFPKYRVFTDSRYINVDVFFDALDMFYAIKAPTNQKDLHYMDSLTEVCIRRLKGDDEEHYLNEYWNSLLEKYKIDFLVGRVTHPRSGQLFPLFLKLMRDESWKLIYLDGNAVILVKDNHKNDEIIKNFPPKDKSLLYDEAIRENINKHSPTAYETLAYAFLMRGDMRNAEIFAKRALLMNNNLKVARACLQFISLQASSSHPSYPFPN
ncbi:MAG TPA: hypothetical protein DCP92_05200 [Nitrospiraceae bacterium]|nr:hypothetical protein [Nitrospiraceae bacterium]